MSTFRVLITDYAWPDLTIERDVLKEIGAEIVLPDSTSESDLVRAATGVDAILTNWAQTSAKVIAAAPKCRIVSRMGIGLDNIDLDYCTSHGIPVTNVPDYCVLEVAEHTLALLLALGRNVAHYHWRTKAGEYRLQDGPPLRRLQGQTLGIIGLGQIGQAVAERARGFGFNILATGRTPKTLPGASWVELDELLERSDYVSLHCPLTPATRHLIGQEQFFKMKSTAFLINTARGGVIDHEALSVALEKGEIAGAALDVQDPEPAPVGEAPYCHPRVLVTPHAAFVSEESLADLRFRSATQVKARLTGEIPECVVNEVDLAGSFCKNRG